jgi:hypothetical protein
MARFREDIIGKWFCRGRWHLIGSLSRFLPILRLNFQTQNAERDCALPGGPIIGTNDF